MRKLLILLLSFILITNSGCSMSLNTNYDNYEEKQYISSERVNSLYIEDSNTDITLTYSDDNKTYIDYVDKIDYSVYDINFLNGELSVVKTGKINTKDKELTLKIALPKSDYDYIIQVETKNGDVDFNKIAGSTCICRASNSDINFENTLFRQYECSTKNGDIDGTIKAKQEDYKININTKNGRSNIKNNLIESPNYIDFSTLNGDIDIQFTSSSTV